MEIQTRFAVGDTIFYMKNNRITSNPVKSIHIEITDKEQFVKYKVEEPSSYYRTTKKYIQDINAFDSEDSIIDNLRTDVQS